MGQGVRFGAVGRYGGARLSGDHHDPRRTWSGFLSRLPSRSASPSVSSVHFTLQRLFVWTHHEEFALPLSHQIGRYLFVAAAQYGVTAASTALLPSALGLPTEVVYLATVAVLLVVNFLVFRNAIFHAKPGAIDPARRSGASDSG